MKNIGIGTETVRGRANHPRSWKPVNRRKNKLMKYIINALVIVMIFSLAVILMAIMEDRSERELEAIDRMIELCNRPDVECYHERSDVDRSKPYIREI